MNRQELAERLRYLWTTGATPEKVGELLELIGENFDEILAALDATPPAGDAGAVMNKATIEACAKVCFDMRSTKYGMDVNIALECAADAIRALPADEGWVRVPREPTVEMIKAGALAPKMKIVNEMVSVSQLRTGTVLDELSGPLSDCAIAQCYKAMLAAALDADR